MISRSTLVRGLGTIAALMAISCSGSSTSPALEVVARVDYEMGADLQFQRRSGVQTAEQHDIVFASAHSDRSRSDGGIEIIDVTDPGTPVRLTRIPCPGYQSDVAVHETLLLQTIDFPGSNGGCDPDWLTETRSSGIDRSHVGGVRIFDVTDPANPVPIAFVEVSGDDGVHNVTVIPWADGDLGILDLNDPELRYQRVAIDSISPEMVTSCHDIGLDPVRELAFCPVTLDETYILDVSEPMQPATCPRSTTQHCPGTTVPAWPRTGPHWSSKPSSTIPRPFRRMHPPVSGSTT
jgi:hypothetical protein